MTHPPDICGHCEDRDRPVSPETGLAVDYVAQPPVLIKIHLHHDCAPAWCSQFGVPEPGKAFDLSVLRDRIEKMSDAELTRFETHARYMLTPDAQRPRTDYEQELHEANDEWRRRHLQQVSAGNSHQVNRSPKDQKDSIPENLRDGALAAG